MKDINMIIKFKKETTLEFVADFNESDGTFDSEFETFKVGSEYEVYFCGNNQIQFADGSVSYVTPDFWQDVEVKE